MRTTLVIALISATSILLSPPGASAQAGDPAEVRALRSQVDRLQQTVEQLQHTILQMQKDSTSRDQALKQKVEAQEAQVQAIQRQQVDRMAVQVDSPLDQALDELGVPDFEPEPDRRALWSQPLGGNTQLRLIDISADVLFFTGGSSERDAAISTLQGGGHDPKQRGFTLGQAEFSLSGAVDPYFTGEAHILTSVNPSTGETALELEEAFLTSSALPYSLQLEVGHSLTEFGLINPQHPHFWDWIDQPVVNSRMFGGDGMRQAGFRASWLPPTPWFSEFHFGMQNAGGVTMASFLGGELAHAHGGGNGHAGEDEQADEHGHAGEDAHAEEPTGGIQGDGIAGRPIIAQDVRGFGDFLYLTRWENSFNFTDDVTAVFGLSGLYGPNSTGRDADTWLYGLDMKWRWQPAGNFGYPFLTWQTEIMKRDYHVARYTQETETGDFASLPGRTLKDWGLYTQLLYGFQTRWAAGLRYEYAGGSGQSIGGRKNDPFRDDRHRLSPLLVWRPSEFSRIRLQYNYDMASHLKDDAHTIWLGFEWMYGAHAAHNF
ncbi:MAG: hypothetical protein OXC18_23580 [Desulfurellaceae bacterium]|nr:hypothetical protein [Desulfurellaceae bacterium]